MTIEMDATEKYFPVILFSMYVVESVDEIFQ